MARGTWVFRDGKLVPKHKAKPLAFAPMVISDGLDYVQNPADGKRYTSKRLYERAVRAAGCEIMGSEAPRAPRQAPEPQGIEQDIKRSIEILRARG